MHRIRHLTAQWRTAVKRFLAFLLLFLFLFLCAAALAASPLEAPYTSGSPGASIAAAVAEALGLDAWQPDVFRNQVDHIIATGPNTLEVHMKDGTVQTVEWKDRSRRDSWTPEMKEKARQDALRRYHG